MIGIGIAIAPTLIVGASGSGGAVPQLWIDGSGNFWVDGSGNNWATLY